MIKILFFIETLTGGGAEKVLRSLVNHMDQTKFAITVQTVWPCDAEKYLAPGIRYKSMYSSASRFNQLLYRAEAESGLAYRLHIQDDYDIECAYLEMGSTKIMASSTNQKAAKLAWVHCDLHKLVTDPRAFASKAAPWYRKYDRVICVSEVVKANYDDMLGDCCPSQVLYNVIDDTEIMQKAGESLPLSLKHRKLTLVSVGRLTKQKNFLRLLQTHERLMHEGVDHDLWILGEGEDRPILEQYIQEHQLEQSVFLPGFLDNPYPCIHEADLAVCSSSYEGFSTFLTECMILGKPIVTTDVSGAEELLGKSEFGLITANDDESFYQGVKTMLTEKPLREHYAEKAIVRRKDFATEQLVTKTEAIFEDLVQKTASDSGSRVRS